MLVLAMWDDGRQVSVAEARQSAKHLWALSCERNISNACGHIDSSITSRKAVGYAIGSKRLLPINRAERSALVRASEAATAREISRLLRPGVTP